MVRCKWEFSICMIILYDRELFLLYVYKYVSGFFKTNFISMTYPTVYTIHIFCYSYAWCVKMIFPRLIQNGKVKMRQLKCYHSLGSFWNTTTCGIANDTQCGCIQFNFSGKKNQKNYSVIYLKIKIGIQKSFASVRGILFFNHSDTYFIFLNIL